MYKGLSKIPREDSSNTLSSLDCARDTALHNMRKYQNQSLLLQWFQAGSLIKNVFGNKCKFVFDQQSVK